MLISRDTVRVGASFAPARAPARHIVGTLMRPIHVPMIVLGLLLAATGCSGGGRGPAEPPAAADAPTVEQSATPPTPEPSLPVGTAQPVDSSAGSGIEGLTMVDGRCPVETDPPSCPAKPISARITVTIAGTDTVVAEATSGADGAFRMALPPGRYMLRAVNHTGAAYPRSSPVEVVVGPRYATVLITFNTGLQ